MNQTILCIILIILVNTLDAMNKHIELPSKEELHARLCSLRLRHFAQETKIHEELGGQTLRPVYVVKTLNSSLDKYCKKLQNEGFAYQMEMNRPTIIAEFFKERPKIVEFLKEVNLLESRLHPRY